MLQQIDKLLWTAMGVAPILDVCKDSARIGPYYDWREEVCLLIRMYAVASKMGVLKKLRLKKEYRAALKKLEPYVVNLVRYSKKTPYKAMRNEFGALLRVEFREALGIKFLVPGKSPRKKRGTS